MPYPIQISARFVLTRQLLLPTYFTVWWCKNAVQQHSCFYNFIAFTIIFAFITATSARQSFAVVLMKRNNHCFVITPHLVRWLFRLWHTFIDLRDSRTTDLTFHSSLPVQLLCNMKSKKKEKNGRVCITVRVLILCLRRKLHPAYTQRNVQRIA